MSQTINGKLIRETISQKCAYDKTHKTKPPRISFPRSRNVVQLCLLVFLLAAGSAVAQQALTDPFYYQKIPPRRGGPLHGNQTVTPFRIIGNVYYVGMSEITSYLITSPQGHILLDPTYDSSFAHIRENIEQLGFDARDIKYIIQSHAHSEHMEGLSLAKELTGARVLVMAGDVPVVADGGVTDFRSDGRQLWKAIRADQTLHDGEQVSVGNATMTAHLTAGHTKGCTTWTTVAEENGRKYDVIFVCSARLNPGVPLIGNKKYPTISENYANTFKKLKSLPVDVFLASHGAMFLLDEKVKRMQQGGEPNPFIAPQDYKTYVAAYEKAYLDELRKERNSTRKSSSADRGGA